MTLFLVLYALSGVVTFFAWANLTEEGQRAVHLHFERLLPSQLIIGYFLACLFYAVCWPILALVFVWVEVRGWWLRRCISNAVEIGLGKLISIGEKQNIAALRQEAAKVREVVCLAQCKKCQKQATIYRNDPRADPLLRLECLFCGEFGDVDIDSALLPETVRSCVCGHLIVLHLDDRCGGLPVPCTPNPSLCPCKKPRGYIDRGDVVGCR